MRRIYTRLLMKVVAGLMLAMALPAGASQVPVISVPAIPHTPTPEFILKKWAQDCDQGKADSCLSFATESSKTNENSNIHYRDSVYFKRAITLWSQSCDNDDADSCFKLGSNILFANTDRRINPDRWRPYHEKALKLFSNECNLNVASSCFIAGSLLDDVNDPASLSRKFDFYRRACMAGSIFGCSFAADSAKRIPSLKMSNDEIKYFEMQYLKISDHDCVESVSSTGCKIMAWYYKYGFLNSIPDIPHIDPDPVKSQDYYAHELAIFITECNKEIADSCWNAGLMYKNGNEVPQNLDLARKYLQDSCKLYSPTACNDSLLRTP